MPFLKHILISLLACGLTTVALHAQSPNWAVENFDQYAHQASMVAELQIDDALNHSLNNKIAFFVDGVVRAVAEPRQLSDNRAVYYLSIFSNQGSGETMEIRAYTGADDVVYTAQTTYDFIKNDIKGTVDNPFTIWIAPTNDEPIDFTKIPNQTVLEGETIEVDLADYLVTTDNDPVNYDFVTNDNLTVMLNGSILTIGGANEYSGTTSLSVRATETTGVNYSASTFIRVKVNRAFTPPGWATGDDAFMGLQTIPDGSFQTVNLNDYEFDYDGDCLEFLVEPIIPVTGTTNLPPDWFVDPTEFQYNMTMTAEVQYTDFFKFQNPNDLLGAFVNGRRRGAVTPYLEGDRVQYYLIIYGDFSGETVNLKFYSHQHQRVFDLPIEFPFSPYISDGTPDQPKILDVSPLKVSINVAGDLNVQICDEDWEGDQEFNLIARDCNYPDQFDVLMTTYTVDVDALALEILDFSGQMQPELGIQLNWEIANFMASTMQIERLTDNQWRSLGQLMTKNAVTHYQWLDVKPNVGNNYYRLRMIDEAGEVTYSSTIVVDYTNDKTQWQIYPNPLQNRQTWLHYQGTVTEQLTLQIFAIDGTLRQAKTLELSQVMDKIPVNLAAFPSGLYYLKIGDFTEKIVIP